MSSILILNGPNLNRLGRRQPEIYGRTTLADLETACLRHAEARGTAVTFEQSNHEGVLIDALHAAEHSHDAVVLNAAGYTHSSVALRDAVAAIPLPVVELHLTNIHAREGFRTHSYIAAVAAGQICGFGAPGYRLAIDACLALLDDGA